LNSPLDLPQVERRVLATLNEDGLLDLGLGLGTLVIALTMNHGSIVYLAMTPVLLAMFVRGMRRRFTYPRVGFAKLKSPPMTRVKIIALVSVTLILTMITLLSVPRVTPFKVSGGDQWLLFSYLPAALILTIAMIFAHRHKVFNIYGYILIVVGCFLHSRLSPVPLQYYLLLIGAVAAATGLGRFIIFLKNHPKPDTGHSDE